VSCVVEPVLEPGGADTGENAVAHRDLVAAVVFGEGAVVAEEDDAEALGVGVVAPVVDAFLGRVVSEEGLICLYEVVAAIEPGEDLGAVSELLPSLDQRRQPSRAADMPTIAPRPLVGKAEEVGTTRRQR
jgi:hypothetical protein